MYKRDVFYNRIDRHGAGLIAAVAAVLAVGLSLSFSQLAIAQPAVPEGLLPGTQEPQREQPLLRQRADEDLVTVPAAKRRAAGNVAEEKIAVERIVLHYDKDDALSVAQQVAAQKVAADYLQANDRSLSFSQLESLAAELTAHYRGAGLMLAQAILPAQEVLRGAVQIDVFVGQLGAVSARDSQLYPSAVLQRPFRGEIGDAVEFDRIESQILRLNDMPGFSSVAVFAPGDQIGETRLQIRATEERGSEYSLRADNYGSEATGRARLLFGAAINNVSGHIDQLRFDGLKSIGDGDLHNFRLGYEITEPMLLHTVGASWSQTRYDVESGDAGIDDLGIEGETKIGSLYLRSQWLRQRNQNFSTHLGLSLKRAKVDLASLGTHQGIDRLTVLEVGLVADAVDTRFRGLHRASLMLHRGFNDFLGSMDGGGNGASLGRVAGAQALPGQFSKITASYNRQQSLARHHTLLLRLRGQYSDDDLSSLEKMSLGGPYSVRAYPVGDRVRDTAIFSSLAWQINGAVLSSAPAYADYDWGDILSLSLFIDYGWGKSRNAADGSIGEDEIFGWGGEVKFRFPDRRGFVTASLASPFGGEEASNGDSTQFWLTAGVDL